jgi:hypothetical protein
MAKKHAAAKRPFKWWALMRQFHHLPVVFRTRKQAEENADPDERVFRVCVYVEREVEKRPRPYAGSPF